MCKKKYEDPTLEIIILQTEDILTSSGEFDGIEHEFGVPDEEGNSQS